MPTVTIPSPMTGSVMSLLVTPGESVTAGQELLLLESMKMEIPIESPAAGTIAEVLVQPGQKVAEGTPLLRLNPD